MRCYVPLAALLVGSLAAPVCAQVSLDEALTRTILVQGKTTVSLAFESTLDKPVTALTQVEWLAPDNRVIASAQQSSNVPSGTSRIGLPLPLPATKADARLLRLRYSVVPAGQDLRAFVPLTGILSLVHIAPYAFSLEVLGPPEARGDGTLELRVLATNPVTHLPIADVHAEARGAAAETDKDGLAVLHLHLADDYAGDEIPLSAHIGDFHQDSEISRLEVPRGFIRIETDKPLYQPGQMLHIRTLAFAADGHARAGTKEQIQVFDADGNLAHTAAVTSSRYGISWTDWTIPTNCKDGQYTIAVVPDDFEEPFDREVEIRAYELPSFRVSAQSARPYYLPHEPGTVDLSAAYLFGKPVPHGRARIQTAIGGKNIWNGELDSTGQARISLPLAAASIPALENFVDRQYIAFVTDPSTNRTEQRRFDVRFSRSGLHLYLAYRKATLEGERLYLSAYLPDGAPARALVSASTGAHCSTNRFGLCRLDIPAGGGVLTLRATTPSASSEDLEVIPSARASLTLETDRVLYRKGESIECHVAVRDQTVRVLLLAWNASRQVLFSRMTSLAGGVTNVEIPYDARFGDRLDIAAAIAGTGEFSSTEVLFPGGAAFHVTVAPAKETYRPGETARIDFHASSQAALGIAIVDQAVLERAEADSNLTGGGVVRHPASEEDLFHFDPAKIDNDLQLLARTLAISPRPPLETDNWLDSASLAFTDTMRKALAPVEQKLDRQFETSRDYPRDERQFYAAAPEIDRLRDSWGRPFYPTFRVEGSQDVLCINSSGPDKRRSTDDDSCVLEIKRPWFGLYEPLIRRALAGTSGFPATQNQFDAQLQAAGILFPALRDPWHRPLAAKISHFGPSRNIDIWSAGPDGSWRTADDISVAHFQGAYFSQTDRRMREILEGATQFPLSSQQALAVLTAAGFHFEELPDPWGHALSLQFEIQQKFADQVSRYTYAEYPRPPEFRRALTPIKVRLAVLAVRSAGPDGIPGTFDDFTLATFAHWLQSDSPTPETSPTPRAKEIPGRATITGIVRDRTSTVIPGASVSLDRMYETRTDADGAYTFSKVPSGAYEIRVTSPGFQTYVLAHVPAVPDEVTQADVVLELGSVSQTVSVVDTPPAISTASAEIASAPSRTSTPRLREYFPETLYWQPEVITDVNGRASVNVKLADSITNWKIVLVASTLKGELEESHADIRAFQPFAVDLDVPGALTEGDRISLPVPIRNYSERAQRVSVNAAGTAGLTGPTALAQPGAIARGAFANVVLDLRASTVTPEAKLKVTAIGSDVSDAIEKPIAIFPDGERFERSAANLMTQSGELDLALPDDIIPGSVRGEVRIYPRITSRILEATSVLLQRPWGCGEQTISSTYPNLLLLRALGETGIQKHPLQAKALHNLQLGYERLLGYQAGSGGFTYWGKDDVDVALTAYAIQFLHDAAAFIEVDSTRMENARAWLALQKPTDYKLRTWQLRGLAFAEQPQTGFDVKKRLAELARAADRFRDPYAIAQFVLAVMEAGQPEFARVSIRELVSSAQPVEGAVFWSLAANTPFHGWGHSGQVETTALAVQALARWVKYDSDDRDTANALQCGALYLLRSTAADGAWATSQATVQALLALLATWHPVTPVQPARFTIRVAGAVVGEVSMAISDSGEPLALDISRFLKPGERNQVRITSSLPGQPFQAQADAQWYQPWRGARPAHGLTMEASFDHTNAAANQAITCRVQVSRPSFRGYGMLIARIGLPPGSEVDRGTLAAVVADAKAGVDSFEAAPGSVTFYIWPRAADTSFSFVFRPRFALAAKSAPSVVYDYYNPDERAVLPPQVFTIQ